MRAGDPVVDSVTGPGTGPAPAIELRDVEKRFGRAVALDRVSFSVAAGEVVGFVGPNGAGKSTALRIITGFLDADAGQVRVHGHDVAREPLAARGRIGYMPEAVPLYEDMRVDEYLCFRARLKGVPGRDVGARVQAVCETCGLGDQRRRIIGQLSKGYRQRVGLADALVGDPPLLVLDEPTAGLDPVQTRAFRDLLRSLAGAHTVLVSSHALADIEAVADRVIVLARGRVVGDGTIAALRASLGMDSACSLEDVLVALVAGAPAAAREGMAGAGEIGNLIGSKHSNEIGNVTGDEIANQSGNDVASLIANETGNENTGDRGQEDAP